MTNENPLLPLVRAALHKVEDPEIRRPITELGMVDELTANDEGQIFIKVLLTVPGCPMRTEISNRVTEAVEAVEGVRGVHVELGVMNDEQRSAMRQVLRGGQPERKIPFAEPGNLTKVIAVASGKGGVGKSSVTVNLAVALAKAGRSVAILDADIYGHSIPDLLGLGDARPTVVDDMILPVPAAEGLKVISVGMLKPSRDQVVAWRGPILDRALTQRLLGRPGFPAARPAAWDRGCGDEPWPEDPELRGPSRHHPAARCLRGRGAGWDHGPSA